MMVLMVSWSHVFKIGLDKLMNPEHESQQKLLTNYKHDIPIDIFDICSPLAHNDQSKFPDTVFSVVAFIARF